MTDMLERVDATSEDTIDFVEGEKGGELSEVSIAHKVAGLALLGVGADLTKLTDEQLAVLTLDDIAVMAFMTNRQRIRDVREEWQTAKSKRLARRPEGLGWFKRRAFGIRNFVGYLSYLNGERGLQESTFRDEDEIDLEEVA